jgi:hypothetical protein
MLKKLINTDYIKLQDAKTLEDILCFATLTAKQVKGILHLQDANDYFKDLGGDCTECKFNSHCLACIINE